MNGAAQMQIRIALDSVDPPCGDLRRESTDGASLTMPFVGWLDLLRVLSDAVDGVMRTTGGRA